MEDQPEKYFEASDVACRKPAFLGSWYVGAIAVLGFAGPTDWLVPITALFLSATLQTLMSGSDITAIAKWKIVIYLPPRMPKKPGGVWPASH